MIEEIELGAVYFSPSGLPFKVTGRSWYGYNCSVPMINYTNLLPTKDKPTGHRWVIEESTFLKTFIDRQDISMWVTEGFYEKLLEHTTWKSAWEKVYVD